MTADDAVALGGLAARLDALEAENRALRAELDALRTTEPAPEAGPAATEPVIGSGGEPTDLVTGPMGRRRALRAGLAAAGAAAAAVVVSDAGPVAAANGSNLVIGVTNNTGTSATRLQLTGSAPQYGFGVVDNTPGPGVETLAPAVVGHARGNAFFTGVRGFGEFGNLGVYGESETNLGVYAVSGSGTALKAESATGGAIELESSRFHLQLTGAPPAPTSGSTPHSSGEILRDVNGTVWLCVGGGTPGTWRTVGGPATSGQLHLLGTPVRVYDSRPGTEPAQAPKTPLPAGNVARTIDLKANGSGVPVGAQGVLVTVLLVNAAAGAGNFAIWSNAAPKPQSNTLVWGGNAGRFTTLAVTAVDGQARVKVDASLQTHLVLDVVGYYR